MFQKMEKNATDAHSSIVPFRDQKSDITMVLAVFRAGPGGGTGKLTENSQPLNPHLA
jgi:hypothetical protein